MKMPKLVSNLSGSTITYLKAEANYTCLQTQKGKTHISAYSLNVFENLLPKEDYLRLNRSNLVNRAFIKNYQFHSNGILVLLANNLKVKVPRRKEQEVLQALKSSQINCLAL